MIMVSEPEFNKIVKNAIEEYNFNGIKFVTGPGRSGAIASVYISHLVGLAFVPYKQMLDSGNEMLIVDTASMTGKTIRKAMRLYNTTNVLVFYKETEERHVFWYDSRYKSCINHME